MPLATAVQTNFLGGELSPRLIGRSDQDSYVNSVATLENFIVQKHGGITARPGTRYVAEVKTMTLLTRLIEFQFSVTQTYILEFGNKYIRFFRDKGQLLDSGTPTEITSPWTTAQLRALKYMQSADILYIFHPDVQTHQLRRTAGDDSLPATWTLAKYIHTDGPYDEINTTTTTMSADGIVVGATVTITASTATFVSTDGPSSDGNRDGRLMRLFTGGIWGSVRISVFTNSTTVDAVVEKVLGAAAEATTEWRFGSWSDTTGWPHCGTFHQNRVWAAATGTQPQTVWSTGASLVSGYAPSDLDGSEVRADNAISATIADDQVNAIRWLVSHPRGLLLLTEGGEFVARGANSDTITAKNFSLLRQSTYGAHTTVRPRRVGSVLLVPHVAGRKIRELSYAFEDDQFVAPDLTVLSEHITVGGLLDVAYQQEPDSILWSVRNDGQLLGLTDERTDGVVAWHRHIIGGSLDGSPHPKVESVAVVRDGNDDLLWMVVERTIDGSTKRFVEYLDPQFDVDGDPESDAFFVDAGLSLDNRLTITAVSQNNPVVVTVASHGLAVDDVVRIRDVVGMTEINDRSFTVSQIDTNTFTLSGEDGTGHTAYVSGGTAAKEVTNITGLGHLVGQSVTVAADGGAHPNKTVAIGGTITLDEAASLVHVGLGYTPKMKSLPMLASLSGLDPRGKKQRIYKVTLKFDRTIGGAVGFEDGSLDEIVYREASDLMDNHIPIFSGLISDVFPMSSELEGTVTVEQNVPLPMTLLNVIAEVAVDGV